MGDEDQEHGVQAAISALRDVTMSLLRGSEGKLPKYSGTEEPTDWFLEYDTLSRDWTEQERIHRLRGYFTGTARDWYDVRVTSSPNPPITLKDLFDHLRNDLFGPNPAQLLRKKLENRK